MNEILQSVQYSLSMISDPPCSVTVFLGTGYTEYSVLDSTGKILLNLAFYNIHSRKATVNFWIDSLNIEAVSDNSLCPSIGPSLTLSILGF